MWLDAAAAAQPDVNGKGAVQMSGGSGGVAQNEAEGGGEAQRGGDFGTARSSAAARRLGTGSAGWIEN
jgi:hypothetical protein